MPLNKKHSARDRRDARELARFLYARQGSDINQIVRGMTWQWYSYPEGKVKDVLAKGRELGWPFRNDRKTNLYYLAVTDEELLQYADEWVSRIVTSVGRLMMATVRRVNPTRDLLYVQTALDLLIDALRRSTMEKAKENLATLDELRSN